MGVNRARKLDDADQPLPAVEITDSKPRIQSALRTISILLAVADSPNGLRAKEIMEKLGLPRQVTYHLIHTMSFVDRRDAHFVGTWEQMSAKVAKVQM